jgi:hypothetical protein
MVGVETREVTLLLTDECSTDPEDLEASVLTLRQEVLAISGIHDLVPRNAVIVPLSKSGAAGIIGSILIAVPASMPVLRELRIVLHDWLHRNDGKHVRLEIAGVVVDAKGLSDDALQELISRGIAQDDST